ncbi:MAG: hypothetical protein IT261_02235 [Saprospiraceae bacterium]|nr:hypothetical protein [Saprospiraceae bacterium]
MKKLPLLLTVITFFFCYLEWGAGQSAFLYEAALQVFSQRESAGDNFSHPLISLPFLGLLVLIYQAFQPKPNRRWVYLGLALPAILVLLILLVGILSGNGKVLVSTLPFLASAVWAVRSYWGEGKVI